MNEGTVNHDSGENWTMQYNTVINNGGAGIFVGAGNVASYNCLKDNSQYGFQAYSGQGGASNIVLDHNEIVGNNTGDWESRINGCGCTGGGKFWDVRNVRVTNNYVHDNKSVGLWADTNDNNFLFEGNWIENNDREAIFWEISYNAAIRNNVIRHNNLKSGQARLASGDNFPDAAIYISESGGDARVPYDLVGSPTIDISNNLIEDNYNGVTLWENADRFCGSPANTSTGYCTLVNPSVAKLSTCNVDEHLQGAVLLGLPLEDAERQGAPQHVQDEPGQLLQLLDEDVWPQRHLLQLGHLPVMVAVQGRTRSARRSPTTKATCSATTPTLERGTSRLWTPATMSRHRRGRQLPTIRTQEAHPPIDTECDRFTAGCADRMS